MITEQQLKEWEEIEKGITRWEDYWSLEFVEMARTALPLLIEENEKLKGLLRWIGTIGSFRKEIEAVLDKRKINLGDYCAHDDSTWCDSDCIGNKL